MTVVNAKSVFPEESVIPKIAVFTPTLEGPNILGVKVNVKSQLSKLPLSTEAGATIT